MGEEWKGERQVRTGERSAEARRQGQVVVVVGSNTVINSKPE